MESVVDVFYGYGSPGEVIDGETGFSDGLSVC